MDLGRPFTHSAPIRSKWKKIHDEPAAVAAAAAAVVVDHGEERDKQFECLHKQQAS